MQKETVFERFREPLIADICNPHLRYSEIAKRLSALANKNFTRSSIAGLIDRNREQIELMGLEIPDRKAVRKTETRIRNEHRAKAKTKGSPMSASRKAKPGINEIDTPQSFEHAVDFIDRKSCQCPFPLWKFPAKIGKVCGAPRTTKYRSSYCDFHAVMCEPGNPK